MSRDSVMRTHMVKFRQRFPVRQASHFLVLFYNNRIAEAQTNIRSLGLTSTTALLNTTREVITEVVVAGLSGTRATPTERFPILRLSM
jgi:hypothetical protein